MNPAGSSSLGFRLIRNAGALLSSQALSRATTFVLYILVARYLGTVAFGQMSLALTLYYTAQVLGAMGLKSLVTREVARDDTQGWDVLVHGITIVAIGSLLAMGLLAGFVEAMNYAPDTARLVLLISLGLPPFGVAAVCEGLFQAFERMHYIAYVNVSVNVVKLALAFVVLALGAGPAALVLLIVLSQAAIALLEGVLVVAMLGRPPSPVRVDTRFALGLARSTSTFLGIDLVIAMWSSAPIVLLSKLATERDVGLYNSAAQLMVPVILVFQSIVQSVYPIMCRQFRRALADLKTSSVNLLELLLALGLPMTVGLVYLANSALGLVYGGTEFAAAAVVLRWVAPILIFRAFTAALAQVLLASLREAVNLRIVAVDLLVSLVLGIILIPTYGPTGAAIASVAAGAVDLVQHYFPVARLLHGLPLARVLWKPLAASACMVASLLATASWRPVQAAPVAVVVYGAVLLGLMLLSSGGPSGLKSKYQFLWTRS